MKREEMITLLSKSSGGTKTEKEIEDMLLPIKQLSGKKLTRKQKFELERDFLIHKNVSDMKNLIEKYYPKGGIPVDWELLKKHNKI